MKNGKNTLGLTALAVVMASVTPHMALANVSPAEFNAAIAVDSPNDCELEVTAPNNTAVLSYEVTQAQLTAGDAGVLTIADGTNMVVTITSKAQNATSDCHLNTVTLTGQDGGEAIGPQKHVYATRTQNGLLWPMQYAYGQVRGFDETGARTNTSVYFGPTAGTTGYALSSGKTDPASSRHPSGSTYSNPNAGGYRYGTPLVEFLMVGSVPVPFFNDVIPAWTYATQYSHGISSVMTVIPQERTEKFTVDIAAMVGTRPYSGADDTPDEQSLDNGEVIRGTGTLTVTAS
ncbi:hypothetical protein DYG63_22285 [Yersinia enterocolitica]|nr:hypothetical protein [Yersinia enterocolitica]